MPHSSLRGKRILIAGGSRGIGLAIAQVFANAGATLSICARHQEGVDNAARQLQHSTGPLHLQCCDLADSQQIDTWIYTAGHTLGGIDVVINNASGDDDASWNAGFDIDLMSAVRTTRAALPWLRRSNQTAIININSINAAIPTPRAIAYSTAKAALNYYTLTMATELAREKIRVNVIAPGSIEHPGNL